MLAWVKMFGLSPKQLKAGIAVVLLATVVWATATLLRVSALLILLNVGFEYILGWLTGWVISKTPKAFRWTIERIEVRINYAAEVGARMMRQRLPVSSLFRHNYLIVFIFLLFDALSNIFSLISFYSLASPVRLQ